MKKWNDLPIKEKAALIKAAVSNGINNLGEIKRTFEEGGDKENPYDYYATSMKILPDGTVIEEGDIKEFVKQVDTRPNKRNTSHISDVISPRELDTWRTIIKQNYPYFTEEQVDNFIKDTQVKQRNLTGRNYLGYYDPNSDYTQGETVVGTNAILDRPRIQREMR